MSSLSAQARHWSDHRLVEEVAKVVSVPRRGSADSFVLHAPLELLARAVLLRHVLPDGRAAARARLVELADRYATSDDPVDDPTPLDIASVKDGSLRLVDSIRAGDLVEVDRCAAWLDAHATSAQLQTHLGDAVVRSLAAAGHAPILLALLPRVDRMCTLLLRGPARDLARNPDWTLGWFDHQARSGNEAGRPGAASLIDALIDAPLLGVPGSTFINPIMRQAEDSGWAEKLLGAVLRAHINPGEAARDLALIANVSMLQEPTDDAKFGWTHCLTMPQAVMALSGSGVPHRTALAVASTHVVGFRAALGSVALDLDGGPGADDISDDPDLEARLASNASAHTDAHLVKYTLACIDAARADPAQPPSAPRRGTATGDMVVGRPLGRVGRGPSGTSRKAVAGRQGIGLAAAPGRKR